MSRADNLEHEAKLLQSHTQCEGIPCIIYTHVPGQFAHGDVLHDIKCNDSFTFIVQKVDRETKVYFS